MLQLGVAARENESPELDARIATLREMVAEALEEVRTLSHTIHPRVLDDLGLAAALTWLARQTREQEALDAEAFADDGAPIPRIPATVLYRVAQESLRNAVRHAQARRVELWLRRTATTATLEVVDDGRGFDVGSGPGGAGLTNLRERVESVGGDLTVASAPGRGTRIRALLPASVRAGSVVA
jgi:signal transduction histidine kinase